MRDSTEAGPDYAEGLSRDLSMVEERIVNVRGMRRGEPSSLGPSCDGASSVADAKSADAVDASSEYGSGVGLEDHVGAGVMVAAVVVDEVEVVAEAVAAVGEQVDANGSVAAAGDARVVVAGGDAFAGG